MLMLIYCFVMATGFCPFVLSTGIANPNSMCDTERSCSISKDVDGLGAAFIVAHEIGHR